jgi:hypothetical protein
MESRAGLPMIWAVLGGWLTTLPLPDYVRVAHHPPANQSQLVKLAKQDTIEAVEPHYYWLLPGNR